MPVLSPHTGDSSPSSPQAGGGGRDGAACSQGDVPSGHGDGDEEWEDQYPGRDHRVVGSVVGRTPRRW